MKNLFLSLLVTSGVLAATSQEAVGWQEFPRTTLTEKCISAALQSVSSTIFLYYLNAGLKNNTNTQNIKVPFWMYAANPTIGACSLMPTILRGFSFKRKIADLKKVKLYDPKNRMDPLLYINTVVHALTPEKHLSSGAQLWKAYSALEPQEQTLFAQKLLTTLEYSSVDWALRAVREAKKQTEQALQDVKKYSDIEDRLNRIIDFQNHTQVTRTEHMLTTDLQVVEEYIEQILDGGTYCQQVTIDTLTRAVSTQDLTKTWHDDDFIYYYASWYAFELLKRYSLLLAFEKISLSLVS
jgi:hypothetical protein